MSMGTELPVALEAPQPQRSRTGCWLFGLGGAGCLVALLVCGGFFGAIVVGVTAMIKNSDPYQDSLQLAQQDRQVIAAIGQPIEASFFVQGSIDLNNNDGDANVTYNISGPNGSANVHVVGTKTAGTWTYQTMTATTNGKVIDLAPQVED